MDCKVSSRIFASAVSIVGGLDSCARLADSGSQELGGRRDMECPSCKAENSDGAKFCTLCYTALGPAEARKPSESAGQSAQPSWGAPPGASERVSDSAAGEATAAEATAERTTEKFSPAPATPPRRSASESSPNWVLIFGFVAVAVVVSLMWLFLGQGGGKEDDVPQVPIPAGAQLLGVQRPTSGPWEGSCPRSRRTSTRPGCSWCRSQRTRQTSTTRREAEQTELKALKWLKSEEEVRSITGEGPIRVVWKRVASSGIRATQVRELSVGIGDEASLLAGVDQAWAQQLRPGANCVVRISCTGIGLEGLEFAEK